MLLLTGRIVLDSVAAVVATVNGAITTGNNCFGSRW